MVHVELIGPYCKSKRQHHNGGAIIKNNVSFTCTTMIDPIGNVQENSRRLMHDYEIGYLVYVEMTGIYCKLDCKKQRPYRITEFFTNGTVQVQ